MTGGRANGSLRTLVLIANAASPALLSAIGAALGTAAAFAVAGAFGFLSVAVAFFSPLRRYDIREAPEDLKAIEPAAEVEATAAD